LKSGNVLQLSEQELAVAESTAYFDEWVMQLLDRIFLVCEHMVEPAKRGKRSVTYVDTHSCANVSMRPCRGPIGTLCLADC
jgi:hypothetical protein